MPRPKQHLINSINSIVGNGSFYSYGKVNFVIPQMKIHPDIEVSLPLQKDTAKKLINSASQAPYGSGNKTLVDTEVRNTWEIDGSQVSFKNPFWTKLLTDIVDKVKDDLALQEAVIEARLYKLLVYEQGGFFLKHKDTEKEEGMFATLVINLPSEFTGGELEIEWRGESKKIDFSKHLYDIGYAAFYTDCDHEVHPIQSGHRISLVYNLIQIDQEAQLGLSALADASDKLTEVLLDIKKSKVDKPFLYLLEHQYTPTNFDLKKLKTNDINRTQVLLQAAKRAGYYIDLGLLHHHINGAPDYDTYGNYNYTSDLDTESMVMAEVYEEYVAIDEWLEVYYPAIRALKLEEVEVLNNRDYKHLEEAIESYAEGYMGNYGPTLQYNYHLGAILFTPIQHIENLIKNATRPILINWIDKLLNSDIKHIDVNHLISTFLRIESRDIQWGKRDLNPLVDSIVKEAVSGNKEGLVNYLGKHLYALSVEKATTLTHALHRKETDLLMSAWQRNQSVANLLAILKLYRHLEEQANVSTPNKLSIYSNSIFDSTSILFKKIERYSIRSKEEKDQISNILKTLLKISDILDINDFLESIFLKNIDSDFIHDYLAPVLIKNQKNRNDLWKMFYNLAIETLRACTKNKPKKPTDWKRDFDYTGKMNTQLEILKSYLLDPDTKTYIYIKAQAYRSEMIHLIRTLNLDISHVTIKKGSPHQLHLTKNENSFHKKLKRHTKDSNLLRILEAIT